MVPQLEINKGRRGYAIIMSDALADGLRVFA